jgi:CRP-like cAMP-binding protein
MISTELLRKFPFFNFMDYSQQKAVAMIAEKITFEKDEVIIEEGKPAGHFYFLIDGDVGYYAVVTSEHDPYYRKEYFVSDINPGEIFGISALIEPHIYTATLKANKTSHVLKVDAASLRALCEVDGKLALGLYRAVAKTALERLQSTRVQLAAAKI